MRPTPPPAIACAHVIEYAIVDDTVTFQQLGTLFVDGVLLGRVPTIAICQNLDEETFMIFHCSAEWEVLGVVADCASLIDAKQKVERMYPGISAKWLSTRYTRDAATRYVESIFKGEECSFCSRIPPQFDRAYTRNNVNICNHCIDEFYSLLQSERVKP